MNLIKELNKYGKLREDLDNLNQQEYTVYKASGPNTEKVFYGYCKGTGDTAIRQSFFTQGNRKSSVEDESRGVQQLIAANGGDINDIEFEELAIVDTEDHAHAIRNEERETDPEAITGPSPFPPMVNRLAMQNHPEIYQRIAMAREFNKLKTAREAWNKKFFDTQKVKNAVMAHKKQDVVRDLDTMSPREFSKKYNLPIESPAS